MYQISVRAAKGFGPAPTPQPGGGSKKNKGGKVKRLKGVDEITKAVERADVKVSYISTPDACMHANSASGTALWNWTLLLPWMIC